MPEVPFQQVQNNSMQTSSIQTKRKSELVKDFIKKNKILSGAIIVLLILILIGLPLLLIFGNKKTHTNTNTTPQPVTLKLWSFTENADHYKQIIEDYHKDNPLITIEFEQRPADDYKSVLETRIKQANGSVADIFELDSKDVSYFQNALSPAPASVLTQDEYQNMYFSQVQNDNILSGNIYGIPTGADGLMLVYNTNLVKESDIPTYWADFIRYAQSKTIVSSDLSDQNEQNGIAVSPTSKTLYLSQLGQLLLLQNKIKNFYDPVNPGIINIDPKVAVDALNQYQKLIEKKPWDERQANSLEAFLEGNTAFAIVKANDIYTIQTRKPSLPFKTHIMPIISEQIYISDYTSYAVSKESPNATEAWKFLKYLSSENVTKKLFATANDFKIAKKPYALKSLTEELKQDPLLAPIGVMSPNMANWLNPDRIQVNQVFVDFLNHGNGLTPFTEEDIKELNDNLNKIIPTYP